MTGRRPRLVVLGIAQGLHLRGPKVRVGQSHLGRLEVGEVVTRVERRADPTILELRRA